ncbi:hypothetical protein F2Q69_00029940 [Brassica cretica]|uniref:Uncharacterized protein n=1 Tax=Brassica cretica TaxID=69181 RepID=A0A8S9RVK2_BRACR|nr:hypothetical protein F2Q69_00029940 [Brassica cretica]
MGYMEIGDNPGFIAVCHCDHGADEESEYETSIDSHPQQSVDSVIQPPIDNNPGESIDINPTNEIFGVHEHCYPSFAVNTQPPTSIDYQYDDLIDKQGNYSIGSWVDNSYHESFAIDNALPEMRSDEYDEDYHKEKMIEYRGLDMEDEIVLHTLHATN